MTNFDPEKLIGQWWSPSPLPLEHEDRIQESYTDAKPFWEGLFAFHQKVKRTPPQSILEAQYDFYHDCILRHIPNEVAYTVIKEGQTENWTFRQLHHSVNFQVRKWSKHDPQPGQLAALVLSPGIEFLIALLTALRFGMKICLLPASNPLLGPQQIIRLLTILKPQLIISEREWIKEIPHLQIDAKNQDETNHTPHSFAYPSTEIVQISLALYRQEPLTLVSLDANTMYLHALRDALFSLNLFEQPTWASPLSCPILTEPCSTIASLLAGARRVHVPDEDIRKNPSILKDERIQIIGVSQALQQLWSRTPAIPTRSLKAFYKDPMDIKIEEWKAFYQINKLESVLRFELLMDNSLGGAFLHSKPHPEPFNYYLKPSPGTNWWLTDLTGGDNKAVINVGFFTTPSTSIAKCNLCLTHTGNSCVLIGGQKPARNGITFPFEELETLVKSFPFVEESIVLPLDTVLGHLVNKRFVLLVFFDPMKKSIAESEKAKITEKIREHLGNGFLPDQIEYYPLIPRTHATRSWCESQYRSGLLQKKAEKPVFQHLHILKKIAKDAEAIFTDPSTHLS